MALSDTKEKVNSFWHCITAKVIVLAMIEIP
jgi:hypothetical protein